MVKLTPELINQSLQHFNAVKDRELVVRGYKIPVIENLGATEDQFDTIDFSENDIRKLDGFPHLKRVKTLLFHNNRIVRIAEDLCDYLPNLQNLYMANNLVQELRDLEPLIKCKHLEHLALLGNPVTTRQHYRLFLIHKIPQLRIIDFRRVKLKEKEAAKRLFKTREGKDLQREIKRSRTFTPGANIPSETRQKIGQMSSEEQAAIRQAIANAKSIEEVERLQHMLRTEHEDADEE
ncbi:U2 small nuclear ribonucleoprotein A' [Armadillidium nasatum]|uniref:Probable U2 small nuclear ribonucleoprotein A' n=1 Tax=Armadillidium nasatum TaxID=96803 RepID=A0A5N5SVQ6_9CRUS|nr:U2 small nuclear ribonucleoprotein A' [Armadillidium nasatum]